MNDMSSDLVCKICNRYFTRLIGYNRHVAVCGPRNYDDAFEWNSMRKKSHDKCDTNGKQEIQEGSLLEITHEDVFQCFLCGHICSERLEFMKHTKKCGVIIINNLYRCNYCDKEFTSKNNFFDHFELCSKRIEKLLKCVKRSKTCFNEKTLTKRQKIKSKAVASKLSKNSVRPEALRRKLEKKKICREPSKIYKKNCSNSIFECTLCRKKFIDKRNLVRHENTIHELNPNSQKCSMCEKVFNRKDNFKRHLESCKNRVDSDFYICAVCGREFDKKSCLKWHIFRTHMDFNFSKCEICGAKFRGPSREVTLQRHVKEYHIDNNSSGTLKCALCVKAFSTRENILRHITAEHDVTISHQHLKFSNIDEFKEWKANMERKSITFFRNRRGFTSSKKYSVGIYECHRSGFYQPKTDDRKRRIKLQGTKKIGTYCPAEIGLFVKKADGSCRVSYVNLHLGHKIGDESELAHLSVPKEERQEIAFKISMGISYDKILKEHIQAEKDRLYFLTRKDLNNISRAFNVKEKCNETSNDQVSDDVNVDSFLDRYRESIIFFKQSGETNEECENGLKKDDSALIIMTEKQKQALCKFGSKVISLDGTFHFQNCHYMLLTLIVIDEYHEGIVVAFGIFNRNDDFFVDVFLSIIREKVGVLKTDIFMCDTEYNYYHKWQKIMSSAQVRPFCKWYVLEKWRRKLKKILDPEKRNVAKKQLYEVSTQLDEELFRLNMKEFFANSDPELLDFLTNFKNYHYDEMRKWAFCFRENSKANVNMHVESLNRALKYFYGKLTNAKTVDRLLIIIKDYLNMNECEMKIKEIKGILSHKLSDLRRRHDECVKDGIVIAIDATLDGWYISVTDEVSEIASVHFIRECDDACSGCKMYCEKCDTCAGKYQCTCADNAVKNNMCMHIHALSMYLKGEQNQTEAKYIVEDVCDSEKGMETRNKSETNSNEVDYKQSRCQN